MNTAGLQCLDQFATNTFVPEDTSGVSLALILGIAIPAGLVAAGLMTVGILYVVLLFENIISQETHSNITNTDTTSRRRETVTWL